MFIKDSEKTTIKRAFVKSLPILFSYVFVSMMLNAGYGWGYALFTSLTVYTGAFQFVLITFLTGGASFITVAVTAFLMNSRQSFYSLSFIKAFKNMGRRKLYMIHTMTDETYAVNCSIPDSDKEKNGIMFYVALFSRSYWMIGTVLGAVIGQLIPFELTGIDFCMTALFAVIFTEQWEKAENHFPAILGIISGTICLFIFGPSRFMLPSLIFTSGILLFAAKEEKND